MNGELIFQGGGSYLIPQGGHPLSKLPRNSSVGFVLAQQDGNLK